jgi:hypothetical protein
LNRLPLRNDLAKDVRDINCLAATFETIQAAVESFKHCETGALNCSDIFEAAEETKPRLLSEKMSRESPRRKAEMPPRALTKS